MDFSPSTRRINFWRSNENYFLLDFFFYSTKGLRFATIFNWLCKCRSSSSRHKYWRNYFQETKTFWRLSFWAFFVKFRRGRKGGEDRHNMEQSYKFIRDTGVWRVISTFDVFLYTLKFLSMILFFQPIIVCIPLAVNKIDIKLWIPRDNNTSFALVIRI